MRIDIDDEAKLHYKFDFERHVQSVLGRIPESNLYGLSRVQVFYNSPEKNNRRAYGFYYGKNEGEQFPRIVLCVGNIFRFFPSFIFLLIPILPKLFLARTIFHEVGHHRLTLNHGFDKKEQEKKADFYVKEMMRRNFGFELAIIYLIFWPLLVLRFMFKRIGKW